jgi:hypothetical protein
MKGIGAMGIVSRKLALALSVVLLLASPAMAGPSMSWGWVPLSVDQAECLRRGEDAVKKQGFTDKLEISKTSVFGIRGDYTAIIDCVPSNGIVFFAVAGPDLNKADDYENTLQSSGF